MARMRSPNYPTIPLKQSIDLVELIYKGDRENAIDKEVAALHMGYSGLTGRTLKLMGALSQFGLLDKVGKGQVRVSKTAVSIIRHMTDDERRQAITKAGKSPALFRKIVDSFADTPSDKTLESFLSREGFTDSAVPAVIKAFRDTNSFIAREGAAESHRLAGDEGPESDLDDEQEDQEMETEERQQPPPSHGDTRRRVTVFEGGPLDFKLTSTGLSVTGNTNSAADLRKFIDTLTTLAKILPDLGDEEDDDEAS